MFENIDETAEQNAEFRQQLIEQQQAAMAPEQQAVGKTLPPRSLYTQSVLDKNPFTYANVSETMTSGIAEPKGAAEILQERQEIIDSQFFVHSPNEFFMIPVRSSSHSSHKIDRQTRYSCHR